MMLNKAQADDLAMTAGGTKRADDDQGGGGKKAKAKAKPNTPKAAPPPVPVTPKAATPKVATPKPSKAPAKPSQTQPRPSAAAAARGRPESETRGRSVTRDEDKSIPRSRSIRGKDIPEDQIYRQKQDASPKRSGLKMEIPAFKGPKGKVAFSEVIADAPVSTAMKAVTKKRAKSAGPAEAITNMLSDIAPTVNNISSKKSASASPVRKRRSAKSFIMDALTMG